MIRRIATIYLVGFALVAVPLGDLGLWTRRELLDTSSFATLANTVVQQPDVRDSLADAITNKVIEREPRLATEQSIVRTSVGTLIGTSAFQAVFERSVGGMHEQLTSGADQLSLQLDPMLPLVRAEVAKASATAANLVPLSGLPSVTVVQKKDMKGLWVAVGVARKASWALPLIALALLAAAVVVAKKRRVVLIVLGVGLAVEAVALVLLLKVGRGLLSDAVGTNVTKAAFDASWDTITRSLVAQTVIIGVVGLLAVGAGVLWRRYEVHGRRPTGWA
jgi:multisubunit Na+/H+ antiporter MnhC subunit